MVIALIRSLYSNDIRTKAVTVVATLLSQVRGGDSDAHAHRVPGDIHLVPSCVEDGTDIQRGNQSKACGRLHALGRRWRQVEYLEILESVQPEALRTYPVDRSRRPQNASPASFSAPPTLVSQKHWLRQTQSTSCRTCPSLRHVEARPEKQCYTMFCL
jgi:hypothetical protein